MTYHDVDIPRNKDPEDYTYTQRRADILRRIKEEGNVKFQTYVKTAADYGVSDQTIHNDYDALQEDLQNILVDVKPKLSLAYLSILKRNLGKNDKTALKAADSLKDFCFEIGDLDKKADKLEVKGDLTANISRIAERALQRNQDEKEE